MERADGETEGRGGLMADTNGLMAKHKDASEVETA
jgi:hypothetical protein